MEIFFGGQKSFWTKFFLDTSFRGKVKPHVFSKRNTLDLSLVDNISAVSKPILTQFFGTLVFLNQFFFTKIPFNKNFFDHKNLFDQIFFLLSLVGRIYFEPKYFSPSFMIEDKFFLEIFFFTKHFFPWKIPSPPSF